MLGGLAVGYTLDHFFGDSDYTGREMFIDSVTGLIGGGLVRPVASTAGRFGKVARNYGDDVYKVGASFTDDLLVAGYITAPMISRPARREFVGGAVAGLVYDIAYGLSSGPRSERNASDVGSGGTPSGKKQTNVAQKRIDAMISREGFSTAERKICGKGYSLVKRRGRWTCVRDGFL